MRDNLTSGNKHATATELVNHPYVGPVSSHLRSTDSPNYMTYRNSDIASACLILISYPITSDMHLTINLSSPSSCFGVYFFRVIRNWKPSGATSSVGRSIQLRKIRCRTGTQWKLTLTSRLTGYQRCSSAGRNFNEPRHIEHCVDEKLRIPFCQHLQSLGRDLRQHSQSLARSRPRTSVQVVSE